jgi:DMSO/TMAO reductase YedYZ molybdopterin-dependent catalytic subunit
MNKPFTTLIDRRDFLRTATLSGVAMLLGGCGATAGESTLNKLSEPFNQNIETFFFDPKRLAPTFQISAIQPKALIINTAESETPLIEPSTYKLTIGGNVTHSIALSMQQIESMTRQSMIIRHVCVEGWAAIVQWEGLPLIEIARLVVPKNTARFVHFGSYGGTYYETWDIASALHPQTMLAYRKNGQPLAPENGAPLRLASAVKLGYKQSKWVSEISFLERLPDKKGYWEDFGYEWFAGI